MMQVVIDSSVLIAILFEEDGHERLRDFVRDRAISLVIGAPTLLETRMVLSGRAKRRNSHEILDTLLTGKSHRVVPFDEGMVRTAFEAFEQFGKGRHPAGLNYGDCMTYAVARAFDLPLLFKGKDFAKTNVRMALKPETWP